MYHPSSFYLLYVKILQVSALFEERKVAFYKKEVKVLNLIMINQKISKIISILNNKMSRNENDEHIPEQKNEEKTTETEYFKLIEEVGDKGTYQKVSLILWCIIWYVTGSILLGTPMLLYDPPYECQGMEEEECLKYVCGLEQQNRKEYLPSNGVRTLANSFGDFHCNHAILEVFESLVYGGSFFGYIVISVLVDNFGRKRIMLISYGIATLGMVIVGFAQSLPMAGIGLFLTGFGSDSAVNICFYFITETVEDSLRQKYSVIIQFMFSLGGLGNVAYYAFIGDWRIIQWSFFIFPSIIVLVSILWWVEDTPYFLVHNHKKEQALASLSRIAQRNSQTMNEQKMIQTLDKLQQSIPFQKSTMTPLHLFIYPSIRKISIFVCLISFVIYALYYGPLMLIGNLGLNIYINAIVVICSEIVIYPFFYFKIDKMARRKVGVLLFALCTVSSLILVFYEPSCEEGICTAVILRLVLIFIFRFCISLEFALFLVFCNQVFPTQIRGQGIGISSALGTIASTSIPYITGEISSNSLVMLVFMSLAFGSTILVWLLPETLNKPIPDQIKQIQQKPSPTPHIELVQQT